LFVCFQNVKFTGKKNFVQNLFSTCGRSWDTHFHWLVK